MSSVSARWWTIGWHAAEGLWSDGITLVVLSSCSSWILSVMSECYSWSRLCLHHCAHRSRYTHTDGYHSLSRFSNSALFVCVNDAAFLDLINLNRDLSWSLGLKFFCLSCRDFPDGSKFERCCRSCGWDSVQKEKLNSERMTTLRLWLEENISMVTAGFAKDERGVKEACRFLLLPFQLDR